MIVSFQWFIAIFWTNFESLTFDSEQSKFIKKIPNAHNLIY